MGLKIGISGVGQFGPQFVPLFQAHPEVDEVVLADLFPERLTRVAEKYGVKRIFASLDVPVKFLHNDAYGLITARHLREMGVNLFNLVHPTKAYVVSCIPRILSMRNSGSRNP